MSPVAGCAADASQVPLPGMVTPPSGLPEVYVCVYEMVLGRLGFLQTLGRCCGKPAALAF